MVFRRFYTKSQWGFRAKCLRYYFLPAGGGYWLHKRWLSAGSFERFDKYDSGAAAGPMQGGGATNVFASSKFGGRMVYPDMQVGIFAQMSIIACCQPSLSECL